MRDFGFGCVATALTSGSSEGSRHYTNFKRNGPEIDKKMRQFI